MFCWELQKVDGKVETLGKNVGDGKEFKKQMAKKKTKRRVAKEGVDVNYDEESGGLRPEKEPLKEGEYEIEKIVGDKRMSWLIKWKGYADTTWEPKKSIKSQLGATKYKMLVDDYEKK